MEEFGIRKKQKWFIVIVLIMVFWTISTTMIQWFKCPQTTDEQLILGIPNTIVLKFKNCN